MNFLNLAKSRFSVRSFQNKPIEEEKLVKVLEAGRLAPSAVNFQPWHFVVITTKEKLDELYTAYNRDWIKQAPAIIVACADHSRSWKRAADGKDSADIDLAIAVDHITLMAAELNLGTCWVCNFDVDKCTQILELPPNIDPIVILPIGYSNIEPPTKKRKSLSEITHLDKFGDSFI